MSPKQEEPLPTRRTYRDVIEEGNALAARARARAWLLSIRYLVDYGYEQSLTARFVDFPTAVAFYMDHLDDGIGPLEPKIMGYAFDDKSDGLTEEEREVVALVREA